MVKNKITNDLNIPIDFKERAIARCRYKPFSRNCYWLLSRYKNNETLFYVNDLCKYLGCTYYTAYRFFEDLTNLHYLKKVQTETLYYELVANGEVKLLELMPHIKKTLGLA